MPSQKITATSTIVLGNGSDSNISSFLVWFRGSNTPSYSIVSKGRAAGFDSITASPSQFGTGVAVLAAADNANIAYQPVATRVMTDPSTPISVTTTTPSGVIIPADGMTVSLVCTKTTGDLEVYWTPLNG